MKERGYVPLSFVLTIDHYKGSRGRATIYKDAAEGKMDIEIYHGPKYKIALCEFENEFSSLVKGR